MKIIVCLKQVPAATSVSIDPVTAQLVREGVESVLNPFDYHALEAALTLKDQTGATVIALSMGPLKAEEILREAVAMGCDQSVLLSDRVFAGSDTWATAYVLQLAVRKLGGADVILCGKQAIDGDTAQVGPQLAAQLDLPQVVGVSALSLTDASTVEVRRRLDHGYDHLRLRLPALLCVERELNSPRVPTLKGYLTAEKTAPLHWHAADLQPDTALIGLQGSPTRVVAAHPAQLRQRNTVRLHGDTPAAVQAILQAVRRCNHAQ